MESKLEALITRLEKVAVKFESQSGAVSASNNNNNSSSSASGPSLPSLNAFDSLLKGSFAEFISLSKTIGGLVSEQASTVI